MYGGEILHLMFRFQFLHSVKSFRGLIQCAILILNWSSLLIWHFYVCFGGLVVSMLASGTQDRGFDPGRSRRIFRVYVEVEITGKIDRPFLARNSVFH